MRRIRSASLALVWISIIVLVARAASTLSPVAVNDVGSTSEDLALIVVAPGLLSNDWDPDNGDLLSVISETITSTLGATITLHTDGGFRYSPIRAAGLQPLDDTETLTDTFSYTIQDTTGLTATAQVLIAVAGQDDARSPLFDMAPGDRYMGFQGGLYPNGLNEMPAAHALAGQQRAGLIQPLDINGDPDPEGRIVMMSIGFSNP